IHPWRNRSSKGSEATCLTGSSLSTSGSTRAGGRNDHLLRQTPILPLTTMCLLPAKTVCSRYGAPQARPGAIQVRLDRHELETVMIMVTRRSLSESAFLRGSDVPVLFVALITANLLVEFTLSLARSEDSV